MFRTGSGKANTELIGTWSGHCQLKTTLGVDLLRATDDGPGVISDAHAGWAYCCPVNGPALGVRNQSSHRVKVTADLIAEGENTLQAENGCRIGNQVRLGYLRGDLEGDGDRSGRTRGEAVEKPDHLVVNQGTGRAGLDKLSVLGDRVIKDEMGSCLVARIGKLEAIDDQASWSQGTFRFNLF